MHLDRTLADLFAFVDEKVGLDRTLIVLSADHGAPEAPGYLESLKIPAGYVAPDTWDTAPAVERIKAKFGIEGPVIEGYDHPYLTLAEVVRNDDSIDQTALETAIAKELVGFEGVAYAIPSSRLREGALPENALTRAVLNNYHPDRSGDIYVVFDPGWFINDMDGLSVTVTHGSPWRYDTYVPILFAGPGIAPQVVSRPVHTIDVALTLATLMGTAPPSGATGEVLLEVLGQ
jgi:arylsulfatase A-like enzyme